MEIVPASERLNRAEAAAFLTEIGVRMSPNTLAGLAAHNNARKGPPFVRTGWHTVFYRKNDLIEWAKGRMQVVD